MIREPGVIQSLCLLLALIMALVTFSSSNSLAKTFSYSITLPKEQIRVETVGSVSRIDLGVTGYERLGDEGQPALPYRVLSVLLPPGQRVESFSFDTSPSLIVGAGDRLEAAAPMVSEDGVAGKGAPLAEVGSGVFPKQSGRYLGTGYLQGCGIASFALFPVRVEGGNVTLSETVTVRITTAIAMDEAVVVRERHRAGHRERLAGTLRGMVVNPEMAGSYGGGEVREEKRPGGFQPTTYPSLEGSAVDYLIITTDALSGEYQRLADWKTAKGIPTVVRTVEWIEANTRNGVDIQETMRNFIQDAYAKWGITYLLLGGDTDIMPPRYGISQFYQGGTELPADMYFSCLDGSWNDNHDGFWGEVGFGVPVDNPDLYADVYHGRIPMSNAADIAAMIDKIISYETAANPGYLNRFLGLAEVLFPPGWKEGDNIELNGAEVNEFLLGTPMAGHEMDPVRMYETDTLYPGSVHESRGEAIDSLNAGFKSICVRAR